MTSVSLPLTRLVRDPQGSESAPLLVLLHGLGSNEADLMGLAPELSPELRVITLRAPLPYAMGGHAWFDIQWGPTGIRIQPDEIATSITRLIQELETIREEFLPPKLLLGGFSQGAIMTVGTTLRRPDLIDAAISMSGRFIPDFFASETPGIERVPFLVQHGVYDQVLDYEGSRQLTERLEERGVTVEAHEYPMAHEVSWQSLRDLDRWIRAQIA